jgi:hypothetical protein
MNAVLVQAGEVRRSTKAAKKQNNANYLLNLL